MARFPERELEIHRACALSEEFRLVCADYEDATAALRRFQEIGKPGDRRICEYQTLLQELEEEVVDFLDDPR